MRNRVSPFLREGLPWLGLARISPYTRFPLLDLSFVLPWGPCLFNHGLWVRPLGWTGVERRPSQSVQRGAEGRPNLAIRPAPLCTCDSFPASSLAEH